MVGEITYNTYNGWQNCNYQEFAMTAGDNTPEVTQYLVLLPATDGDTISSFLIDDIIANENWLAEISNGDPTQTKTIFLIGGLPAQTPPQIVLPPGYSKVELKPGFTQRIAYIVGVGWTPLFNGTLM